MMLMGRSLRLVGLILPMTILGLGFNVSTALATTHTVTNCSNDTEFSNALVGGGTITFNCGVATVLLTSTKTISAATTINGGDKITLSGGGARQLFVVNGGTSLDLVHIVLKKGFFAGAGGAIVNHGFLALDYASILNSTAGGAGGAIFTDGQIDITGSTLAGNSANAGGAIDETGSGASVTIAGSLVHDNQATTTSSGQGGGAIYVDQDAQLYVYSSDVHDNSTGSEGGAIHVVQALPGHNHGYALIGATTRIRNNSASRKGGGIFNSGMVDIQNAALSGNKGVSTGSGGAIYNYGDLTITNATLSMNQAYYAGAIANVFNRSDTITNVTISGNSAQVQGGGIYNLAGTLSLTNVTLAANSQGTSPSTGGGGIYNSNSGSDLAHLNLKNVLVANSPSGGNCRFDTAPASSVANLSTDATCSFGSGRDNVTINLGPLETNGGLTLTQRLLPGSIAINDGTNTGAPSTDQRGVSRPQGGTVDVGAVEFVPCPGVPTTKPALVGPVSGSTVKTTQPVLDWYGPDCATKFKVIVRHGNPTGTIVFSKVIFPATQVKTSTLSHGVIYDWQVKACDAAGCLSGDHWTFRVK